MMKAIFCLSTLVLVALVAQSSQLRADTIELVNGDLLHGKVVSLDDRELRLVSDIHGAVIIDRDKVAAIGLGERKLTPPPVADVAAPAGNDPVVRRTMTVNGRPTVTATVPLTPAPTQDIVRQLRAQGLSAENITELQKALPLLKEPGAKKYFDDTVKGLAEGSINVDNVRKDAIRAREEYRKTAKNLGPDGEKTLDQALGGYLQILDKFIRDTEPTATDRKTTPAEEGSKRQSAPEAKKAPEGDVNPNGAAKQIEKSIPRR
jgi:hypothetical protein